MNYRNRWALVTGASAGIGAAFSRALAQEGANLVLVARRRERLEAIARELENKFSNSTIVIEADLARPESPIAIVNEIKSANVQVDILVNNAGFGLPGFYCESEWTDHRDFIELMMTSYAQLTRLLLPGMLKRGYGRIIQVASVAGLVPGSAGHTLYGPSKAFLVSFAQSIAAECEGAGVNSSALCPGFTYSEFHDVNDTRGLVSKLPKYMFMDAEPVVAGALQAVERGRVVYVPGAWNKFLVWLVKALPRPWAANLMRRQSKKFRRAEAK